MSKIGRNEPCHCGSGKKYKKCHLPKEEFERHPPQLPPEVLADLHRKSLEATFSGPQSQKVSFKGKTIRVLWNKLDVREPTETFHEYLVDILKRTFGRKWMDLYKPPNQNGHVVKRWIYAWHALAERAMPRDHKPGAIFGIRASGEAMALIAFADDLYRLQLVHRLPRQLLERLRSPNLFQGARYEVAVAAIFVRAGFDIQWLSDKDTSKHCEFVATHKATRQSIAVETKSRHRRGVLNHPGAANDVSGVRADVDALFKAALDKDPGSMPFAIFIDLNRLRHPQPGLDKPWMQDMRRVLDAGPPGTRENPSPYNLLCVTNYSWHYDGDEPAGSTEFLIVVSPNARHAFGDGPTLAALEREIHTYPHVPADA